MEGRIGGRGGGGGGVKSEASSKHKKTKRKQQTNLRLLMCNVFFVRCWKFEVCVYL